MAGTWQPPLPPMEYFENVEDCDVCVVYPEGSRVGTVVLLRTAVVIGTVEACLFPPSSPPSEAWQSSADAEPRSFRDQLCALVRAHRRKDRASPS